MSKKMKDETPEEVIPEKKLSDIIKPEILVAGAPPHPLIELFDKSEKLPIIKSISMMRVPGKNTHMSLVLETQGDKVLSIRVGEPNLRLIVVDEVKINCVHNFFDGGFDG